MDESGYRKWRSGKLKNYPCGVEDLRVSIGGLGSISAAEADQVRSKCARYNMAIYSCENRFSERADVIGFAARFGLRRADLHLCAKDDGVAELSVADGGPRGAYVPYSDRGLSWHTDGYYNPPSRQVRAVVLHCVADARSGGENGLLDPDMAYIRLRDEDPRFITAFEHPACMTIPANTGPQGEIRPAVTGPVFSYPDGAVHMRYSARKKNIQWRDDAATSDARAFLGELLASGEIPVLHYRLRPGEGLISNNVLHDRTAFEDGEGHRRLLYRARFFDRIGTA